MKQKDEITDEQLLLQLKSGNNEEEDMAFEMIYKRYHGYLFVKAVYHLDDTSLSEDVVQDLFSTWWQSKAFLNVHENLRNYMTKAVRYECMRRNVKTKVEKRREETYSKLEMTAPSEIEYLKKTQLGVIIRKVVDEMNGNQAEVFKEVYYLERDRCEIIKDYNISEQTLRNYLTSVKNRIRQKCLNAFE